MWDKHPTDMFALCSTAEARNMFFSTVMSPSFTLLGVQTIRGGVNVYIQPQLHQPAADHGILEMAHHYRFIAKALLQPEHWHAYLLRR